MGKQLHVLLLQQQLLTPCRSCCFVIALVVFPFSFYQYLHHLPAIHSCFIDYYMEEGLLRDIFTHKITTQKHCDMLMQPTAYSKDEVAYDVVVGNNTVVTSTYDPHCLNDVSGECHPVQVIIAERLVKAATGPAVYPPHIIGWYLDYVSVTPYHYLAMFFLLHCSGIPHYCWKFCREPVQLFNLFVLPFNYRVQ